MLRHYLRQFIKSLLLFFCCALLFGPQAILQLGAWSWMLTSYTQESSLKQAIQETFGGERPCDMCKIIDSSDDPRNEAPTTKQSETRELKLMLGLGRALKFDHNSTGNAPWADYLMVHSYGVYYKPTPPPRAIVRS